MAAVIACYRHGLEAATPSEKKTATAARAIVEDWFKVPKTAALVAKSFGDKVEGIVFFRVEAPAVRILYVSVREHRTGAGSQLVGGLRELSAKKGLKELKVTLCAKDERQKSFFGKKMGFALGTPAGDAIEASLALPAPV